MVRQFPSGLPPLPCYVVQFNVIIIIIIIVIVFVIFMVIVIVIVKEN